MPFQSTSHPTTSQSPTTWRPSASVARPPLARQPAANSPPASRPDEMKGAFLNMGTVQHHQARSDALLRHAHNANEAAIAAPATPGPHPPDYIDPFIDGLADAVDSIQRAAAHAATALAVHIGLRHNTTRRLRNRPHRRHLLRPPPPRPPENLPPHLHPGGSPQLAHARLQNRQPRPRRRQRRQCRERRPRRPPPPPSPHPSRHHRPPRSHRPHPDGNHHPDHPQDAETRRVPQKRHLCHHRRPPEAGPPRQTQPPLRHRLRPHHAHRRRNPVRRRNHPPGPTTRNS